MKSRINYPVKVFATGLVVLVLLSIPLFWFRFVCKASQLAIMPDEAKSVSIEPSGLVPDEFEKDPNIIQHSQASARIRSEQFQTIGIFDYFQARSPGGRLSSVYLFKSSHEWTYFDTKLGQLVLHYIDKQTTPDKNRLALEVQLYVGPEGISEIPEKTLGRFIDPIIDRGSLDWGLDGSKELIVYDKELRRFFKLDLDKQTIVKGPKLNKRDFHKPIQIGRLKKETSWFSNLFWNPPQIKDPDKDADTERSIVEFKPIIPDFYGSYAGPYLLVLDETGRIDLLDKETLTFAGTAGRLPVPPTLFGYEPSVIPRDLLDYNVKALSLTTHFFESAEGEPESKKVFFGDMLSSFNPPPARTDRKYLGLFAISLSQNGTSLALTAFDENGAQKGTAHTELVKYRGARRIKSVPSSKAVLFEVPWAPVLTISKYLSENLHPPILSLASYFTATSFEAASGHRALFLLPNSFIALRARAGNKNINAAERFISALFLISPAIILSILLAYQVNKDAVVVGLSQNARLYWVFGTLAFGLSAYITYKLTKPKITLVSCQNCGKPRRPDMDKCHRCKSGWHVPELTPPLWRVLNDPEQIQSSPPADEEEIATE